MADGKDAEWSMKEDGIDWEYKHLTGSQSPLLRCCVRMIRRAEKEKAQMIIVVSYCIS